MFFHRLLKNRSDRIRRLACLQGLTIQSTVNTIWEQGNRNVLALEKPITGGQMDNIAQLSHYLALKAKADENLVVIQEPQIGQDARRNELLMFVKPEVFMVDSPRKIERTLELVIGKLCEFKVDINGLVIVGGKLLEQKVVMNRHYGFINELSRKASTILGNDERKNIEKVLSLTSIDDYAILGGHEYLKQHPGLDVSYMDKVWNPEKSVKLRSGFYVQTYETDDERIVLVNGFHPTQLAHYTEPSQRILLILLHSDTEWTILRNSMVGATFPEKAAPGSIRNSLYIDPQEYGFESVTVATNGVHLSAGPFEAGFEITNFFGRIVDPNRLSAPLIQHRMQQNGLSLIQSQKAFENPLIQVDGKYIDLFTATEDEDTEDAVNIWLSEVKKKSTS